MKAYEGKRCITPLILNLGSSCRRLVNFTPVPLQPGEHPRYPLNRRLGGPEKETEQFGEDKIPVPLPGLKLRTVQPVAIPASQLKLSKLYYT